MDASTPELSGPRPLPVPTTFAGVAGLAGRPAWCLFSGQLITALAAAVVAAWSLDVTWGRALEHAAESLPDRAGIRAGRLHWPGTEPVVLHENAFLSVIVDPGARRDSGHSGDVALQLEDRQLALSSLFGWLEIPYPPDLEIQLGRFEALGALAAWKGPVLLGFGCAVAVGLLLAWWALSATYAMALAFMAFVFRRSLDLVGAWRLAGAALIPGAILMTAAIALYATHHLGMVGLLIAVPLHIAVGWIFCIGALRHAAPPRDANPFGSPAPGVSERRQPANPFEIP